MKRLFILAPAILLTAIIHSADTSSITVALMQKMVQPKTPGLHGPGRLITSRACVEINEINLNSETFESLTKKIYSKIYQSDELKHVTFHSNKLNKNLLIQEADVEIECFEWSTKWAYGMHYYRRNPDCLSTLSAAGLKDKAYIYAILIELKELESHEFIKEPGVD